MLPYEYGRRFLILPPMNMVGVFLMLPYDYGRRLFDATITKYRRFLTLFL